MEKKVQATMHYTIWTSTERRMKDIKQFSDRLSLRKEVKPSLRETELSLLMKDLENHSETLSISFPQELKGNGDSGDII